MISEPVDHTKGLADVVADVNSEIDELRAWIARLDQAHHNQELRRRVEHELELAGKPEPRCD